MTIKNHTFFANGELFTRKHKNDFVRFYGIKSLVIKNNTTKLESEFIREKDIKLMKSLSNIGIYAKLNKSRYNKISRRVNKFYKDTFSTK